MNMSIMINILPHLFHKFNQSDDPFTFGIACLSDKDQTTMNTYTIVVPLEQVEFFKENEPLPDELLAMIEEEIVNAYTPRTNFEVLTRQMSGQTVDKMREEGIRQTRLNMVKVYRHPKQQPSAAPVPESNSTKPDPSRRPQGFTDVEQGGI